MTAGGDRDPEELVVVGIDPGSIATGYGVVARRRGGTMRLLECGVIRPTRKAELAVRILEIFEGVTEILERFRPDTVAVESVFQGKNARSALILGHARGAILVAGARLEIEVAEYTPVAIKKAVVGHGSATKDQVGLLVQEQLRLKEPPRPSDAADGVACALCHLVLGVDGRLPGALPHRFARSPS
ncbi:MAG: crossover junction endodeoxyribonuclease RuvC [Gemmatimonadales bacterium]|nr:MAG: crossover junction endodeoxyribonuclease RuvC [Gemmatimonadales bacterium]